jgi:hypothetical protein
VPALAAQMRRLVLRPSSSRSTVFQQSRVSAWGNAEAGFEMPRHMALIGEACGDGSLGKSKPADDPSANPKETPADEMAMRRSTHFARRSCERG